MIILSDLKISMLCVDDLFPLLNIFLPGSELLALECIVMEYVSYCAGKKDSGMGGGRVT